MFMPPRAEGPRHRGATGFSLLELMVALAVFALVALALLNLSGENVRIAVVVEERVMAGVVAENRAVEAMLLPTARLGVPAAGRDAVGGREWRWTRATARTNDPSIMRLDIRVQAAGTDQVIAEAQVFRSTQ